MITSKVLGIGRELAARLPTRGEILVLEQRKVFESASVTDVEQRAPQTRGEVAMQEQLKIMQATAMANKVAQSREPLTRGEVVIQEQMRIFGTNNKG